MRFPDSLPTFEYSPSRGKSPRCFAILTTILNRSSGKKRAFILHVPCGPAATVGASRRFQVSAVKGARPLQPEVRAATTSTAGSSGRRLSVTLSRQLAAWGALRGSDPGRGKRQRPNLKVDRGRATGTPRALPRAPPDVPLAARPRPRRRGIVPWVVSLRGPPLPY